jgi:hypothetical protein
MITRRTTRRRRRVHHHRPSAKVHLRGLPRGELEDHRRIDAPPLELGEDTAHGTVVAAIDVVANQRRVDRDSLHALAVPLLDQLDG